MIMVTLQALSLSVIVLALCAVITAADKTRTTTRQYPLDGGNSISVKEYQFPGAIQAFWWVSDQDLVVMAKGHLFLSRNYASTGEWVPLTEDIPEFAANNSRVAGMGTVTGLSFNEFHSNETRDLLMVQCLGPITYVLSISTEPMIVGRVELENVPAVTFNELRDGTENVMKAGMSVVFLGVQYHPTLSGSAIALLRDPACKLLDTFRCRTYVYYTEQGISDMPYVTWRLLHTSMDAMQVVFGNSEASTFDPNTAFFLSKPTMANSFLDGKLYTFSISDVAGNANNRITFDEVLSSTFGEESKGGYSVIAAADSQHKIRLYVSSDNFQTTPTAANFGTHIFPSDINPYEEDMDEQETGYTLLDVQDEVFVNVYRGTFTSAQQWGHTYLSGAQGKHFTLSLPYNRRLNRGDAAVDFHRVAGLSGMILANVVINPQDVSCRNCASATDCDQFCEFVTVLSRDNGKSWQRIPSDSTECESSNGKECSLNLHSYSSASTFNTHPLVSSKSAPGLIIATGNEGSSLDLRSENVMNADVFISRDAGETWSKLSTGRGIYGETDYGGALYLFPTGRRSRHVNFSIDEGATWSYFPVQDEGKSYVFSNVINSKAMPNVYLFPTGRRSRHVNFSIDEGATWSYFPVQDEGKSYVFSNVINSKAMPNAHFINVLAFPGEGGNDVALWIDLSDLKDRNCVGLENPNDPNSDFEYFQPSSYFDEQLGFKCFMGHTAFFARKRYGAACWVTTPTSDNGATIANYLLPRNIANCNCTRADYECDMGYVEDGESCIPEPPLIDLASSTAAASGNTGSNVAAGVESSSAHADIAVKRTPTNGLCVWNNRVDIKTGYRKMGGNTCQGGIDLNPTSEPCPKSTADHAVGILALLVLVVAGVLLLIIHKARASSSFSAAAVEMCPPLKYILGSGERDLLNQYTIADGSEDGDDDDTQATEEHRLTSTRSQAPPPPQRRKPADNDSDDIGGEELASQQHTAAVADTFSVPVTVSENTTTSQRETAEVNISAESRAHFVELNAMQPPPVPSPATNESSPSAKRGLDLIDFGQ
ncbi:membrane-associated protein, putative [Bodo saltans]|uniref:Membrane-associated protein, putative n=1 Tax=Bodo saltans TaxID=75058 RepID=A0A0S4J6U3_BODSA|nr:membrane-associated protein, putative [Bodo saltans]|eukprot:CUG71248.1 membrane-associated protein, putative [Bodo saltans]